MARWRNENWSLTGKDEDRTVPRELIQLALLMDIRDELQALNHLLNCRNVIGGFRALQTINKRMGKFDALKLRKPK